ncbi:hypothetical protein SO802_013297 [Lithocarpus litseifolius]|uniref:RNase H type-1 domain-containing protein n=1 Tax=Lithocarpus litseifolius TaxID=425828 RepID=A0AAW2DAQ3_9ROSI
MGAQKKGATRFSEELAHVPLQAILLADSFTTKFRPITLDRPKVLSLSLSLSIWQTPPLGLVKINFDGAVFEDANMSGVGVVIKDNNGFVLASCSEKIPQAYKPDEIETLAAKKALSFAHELGFRCAILEGDSLGLI